MNYADRVKETTTATSTTTITLAGAVSPMRSFAAGFTVGTTDIPVTVADTVGNFESGVYTLTGTNTLTRTALVDSSNGGAAVTFPAGSKDVFCSVHAKELAKMPIVKDVAFSTTIPLSQAGTAYMAPTNVTGALTFTPSAGAVRGAMAILRLTVNTATMPTFTGFKHLGGSYYDNRVNAMNLLQFSYDGVQPWVFVTQEEGTVVAAPTGDTTGPTMNGTLTSSSVGTTGYTLSWSAATDAVGVTGYEYSANGGTNYTDIGNVLTKAVTGLSAATQYQNRVRAYDAAGNRSTTPLSLTVTTAATADTTDPTMSGSLTVTNVGSDTYTMNWPAGSDNVAVTGYETSTDGGSTYSDAGNVLTRTITGATASTQYNLSVRAYDAAGRRSTPLSATVTTTAAAGTTYDTLTDLHFATASGTNPTTYTGTGESTGEIFTTGNRYSKNFVDGVDGSIIFEPSGGQWGFALSTVTYSGINNTIQQATIDLRCLGPGFNYVLDIPSGGAPHQGPSAVGTANVQQQAGDRVKIERTGSAGGGNTGTVRFYVARVATPNTWIEVYNATQFRTEAMYARWCPLQDMPSITKMQSTGLVA